MMSVPGLALFYGGLVRTKNMLSVLTQVFAIVSMVGIIWVVYGYSLAFTEGSGSLNPFIGGFSRVFLAGMTPDSTAATFSNGVVIPEMAYMVFQMTFAMITPALIVGAFAERMKFSAVLLFVLLWVTFVYFPIAHSVWYWPGPDAVADAARALAAAPDAATKATAQAALDAVNANAGYNFQQGALDFAGGTVVHINAGIAGLVGALLVGKRVGYGREPMPPHSLTMTMIGAIAALGRLVRLQRRLQPRGQWRHRARLCEYDGRHRGGRHVVAHHGMADEGQTLAARHGVGRGGGPRRRHAGFGLRRADGRCGARDRREPDLPVLRLEREELAWL